MATENLNNCPVCGEPIARSAISCPKCGAKIKKPLVKRWWFWVLIVFIAIAVIGGSVGSSSKSGTSQNAAGTTAEKKEPFELQGEITVEQDSYTMYLCGIVANNMSHDASYAQITFNLYDADGNLIGTAMDNINNLKSGGTWKFKALAFVESGDIASYELAEISGW